MPGAIDPGSRPGSAPRVSAFIPQILLDANWVLVKARNGLDRSEAAESLQDFKPLFLHLSISMSVNIVLFWGVGLDSMISKAFLPLNFCRLYDLKEIPFLSRY